MGRLSIGHILLLSLALHLHYCQALEEHLCFADNPLVPQGAPMCSVPLENLVEGLGIHGVSPRENSLLPPWMDHELYRTGQLFVQENLAIITYCHYMAAPLALANKEGAQILSTTRKSDTVEAAIKRNLANLKHTWLWYEYDLLSPGGHIAAQSLEKIRNIHTGVGKLVESRLAQGKGLMDEDLFADRQVNEGLWEAVETDLKTSNIPEEYRNFPKELLTYKGNMVPFGQYGMSIAQFSFAGLPFIMTELMSIMHPTREQLLGWNHLWAVLGYALGIEDKFNIALQPNLEDAIAYYRTLFKRVMLPNLFHMQKESKVLIEIVSSISDQVFPSGLFKFTPNILMVLLLEEIVNIPAVKTRQYLSFAERSKLESWTGLKKSLRRFKHPLMEIINSDLRSRFDHQGKKYFGEIYSGDESISMSMYS